MSGPREDPEKVVQEALRLGLKLTREALSAASRADWGSVGGLQHERRAALHDTPFEQLDGAAAARLTPMLRDLVSADRDLAAAAAAARHAALTELRGVRQRRRGSASYHAQKASSAPTGVRTLRLS